MKYKEWLSDWLENYVRSSVKSRTFNRYSEIVQRHIVPELGDYELEELDPLAVQRYITKLAECGNLKTGEGLSSNSINAIVAVIQNSLELSAVVGVTDAYLMNKLKRPRSRERDICCFTVVEQKMIEEAVMSDKREKMKGIILCLYTGLRIGELLALEWEDIDMENAELRVCKSCYDGKDESGNYTRITDTPKTRSSNRVIPIPRQIIPMIAALKGKSISKYVISNGEKYISVRCYQRSFETLLKKLNIPHRGFHSLRHTFATRAIECGMDVKTLSEILGHKSPTVTLNRYVHSMMEHKKEMMNKVGARL